MLAGRMMLGLQTILALQTTLVRRMILVLQTTLVHQMKPVLPTKLNQQMMLVLKIIPRLRTAPSHRMTAVLQTTKDVGAEGKKVVERTSKQGGLATFF
jgi:hypothetical protein